MMAGRSMQGSEVKAITSPYSSPPAGWSASPCVQIRRNEEIYELPALGLTWEICLPYERGAALSEMASRRKATCSYQGRLLTARRGDASRVDIGLRRGCWVGLG